MYTNAFATLGGCQLFVPAVFISFCTGYRVIERVIFFGVVRMPIDRHSPLGRWEPCLGSHLQPQKYDYMHEAMLGHVS